MSQRILSEVDELKLWSNLSTETEKEKILKLNVDKIVQAFSNETNKISEYHNALPPTSDVSLHGYLNIMTNFALVGALFISVLFQFNISPITPSPMSLNFFGHTIVRIFTYIHFICVSFALFSSLLVIIGSVKTLKILGVWLPPKDGLEFAQKFPVNYMLGYVMQTIFFFVLSVPFGAAVIVDPIAGLISLVAVIYFGLSIKRLKYLDDTGILILHKTIKTHFESKGRS
jgi:hypothetical protein